MISPSSMTTSAAACGTQEHKQQLQQRQVQFDANVVIYEFVMRMGDNPAVSSGCPIGMAMKHQHYEVRNFEMYEHTRNLDRKPKRQQHHKNRHHHHQNNNSSDSTKRSSKTTTFCIPVEQRTQILIRAGYSLHAIAKTILQVETIKEQRLETLRKSGWDNFAMLAMDTQKVPKGILKAVLGSTSDIWSAASIGGMLVTSGVVVVGKHLTKAFSTTDPKSVQARSA
jgi:hypothetical protein